MMQGRVLLFLLVVILAILIVCLCDAPAGPPAIRTHPQRGISPPGRASMVALKAAGGPHIHRASLDHSGAGRSSVQMGHGHQISRFKDQGISLDGNPLDHSHEVANIGDFIVPTAVEST